MADNVLETDVNGGKIVPKRRAKKKPVPYYSQAVRNCKQASIDSATSSQEQELLFSERG